MKTPTLIVRLIGLYWLTSCTLGLFSMFKIHAAVGQLGGSQNEVVADIEIYLWVGVVVGLGASRYAGPLARMLTFDSEPKDSSSDFGDKFIDKK